MYRKWCVAVAIAREELMVKILAAKILSGFVIYISMNNPNLQIVPTDHFPSPDLSVAVQLTD
jgi:hypothetical protein